MPEEIESNFNKLYFFKEFNNYFNRKLLKGDHLEDYIGNGEVKFIFSQFQYSAEPVEGELNSYTVTLAVSSWPLGRSLNYSHFISPTIEGEGSEHITAVAIIKIDNTNRAITIKFITDGATLFDLRNCKITYIAVTYPNTYIEKTNVNFSPNDGVTTEVVVNDIWFEPDYLLVMNFHEGPNIWTIDSRWFVIETARTRKGQYIVKLRRDVIADYLNNIMESPIYVHRGMLEESDPFILNDEGMSLNQIKKSEKLLKDYTNCPWLVVYYAKNTDKTNITTKHFSFNFPGTFYDYSLKSKEPYNIAAFPFGYLPHRFFFEEGEPSRRFYSSAIAQKLYSLEIVQGIIENLGSSIYDVQLLPYCPLPYACVVPDYKEGNREPYIDPRLANEDHIQFFPLNLNDEDRFEGSAKDTLTKYSEGYRTYVYNNEQYEEFTKTFTLDELGIPSSNNLSLGSWGTVLRGITHAGRIERSPEGTPPLPNVRFTVTHEIITVTVDEEELISGVKITVSYKPHIDDNIPDYLSSLQITLDVVFTDSLGHTNGTFALFVENNQFEVPFLLHPEILTQEISLKVLSNCYKYRIVSPNYQGTFEINAAKNGGRLRNFRAFCTYKPFTPMIKIAPEYDLLYGTNFKDDRGLICSSNFSITMITSQWVEYQLQNKNYQNIFNRDIQNLDFNQDVAMRETIVGGVVGTMQGALAGAAAGGMMGGGMGPWGAAAGAVTGAAVGAAASGIAAAADVEFLGMRQKEERSYQIDKYNYQLGNIKAIPNTLTKVTSFDILCKIFPFVEEYVCTDEELEAFNRKITYESMTVMRIDTISNYYHKFDDLKYFKGELIRCDNINADYHILIAIYSELMKGVFL